MFNPIYDFNISGNSSFVIIWIYHSIFCFYVLPALLLKTVADVTAISDFVTDDYFWYFILFFWFHWFFPVWWFWYFNNKTFPFGFFHFCVVAVSISILWLMWLLFMKCYSIASLSDPPPPTTCSLFHRFVTVTSVKGSHKFLNQWKESFKLKLGGYHRINTSKNIICQI